jgi:hypothetical protein
VGSLVAETSELRGETIPGFRDNQILEGGIGDGIGLRVSWDTEDLGNFQTDGFGIRTDSCFWSSPRI